MELRGLRGFSGFLLPSKWEEFPPGLLLNRGAAPSSYDTKKWCVTSERGLADTRKLFHRFLHSFPLMEDLCASAAHGDGGATRHVGKRGSGKLSDGIIPAPLRESLENLPQRSKLSQSRSDFFSPFNASLWF